MNTIDAIELKRNNASLNCQQIGDSLGITRERVRQILTRAGIPTAKRRKERHKCPVCGRPMSKEAAMCWRCYVSRSRVTLRCSQCGQEFQRPRSQAKRMKGNLVFCGKSCQGRWLGLNYGVKFQAERST